MGTHRFQHDIHGFQYWALLSRVPLGFSVGRFDTDALIQCPILLFFAKPVQKMQECVHSLLTLGVRVQFL